MNIEATIQALATDAEFLHHYAEGLADEAAALEAAFLQRFELFRAARLKSSGKLGTVLDALVDGASCQARRSKGWVTAFRAAAEELADEDFTPKV